MDVLLLDSQLLLKSLVKQFASKLAFSIGSDINPSWENKGEVPPRLYLPVKADIFLHTDLEVDSALMLLMNSLQAVCFAAIVLPLLSPSLYNQHVMHQKDDA